MDFGSLLHAAHANEVRAKKEPSKCYRTSFSPPRKENKNKSLSVNIQKFLARKEEEEKLKELEAKKKREELLALRSQDNKAKKRVGAMLKRTKSANKSAIEDAVDDDNTAVTINGPSQPDEDDYGYVSQEASAYYNKLMDKYNSTPAEEPMFSQSKKVVHRDLNSTKDRVRMALLKEEEEDMMPHKRKRKSKSKKEDDPGDTTLDYSTSDMRDFVSRNAEDETDMAPPPPSKPKPKKMAPPPMDFHDLLKLAEKKQFEPIKIEPKKKPEDEDVRPMTKKQKVEYMKEQEWRRRKEEAAKVGRENPHSKFSQNNVKGGCRGDNGDERPSTADTLQDRQVRSVQQMRIPKLNSIKIEEKQHNSLKKEEVNNVRRDEKLPAQKHPKTSLSGNLEGPNQSSFKLGDKISKLSSGNETVTKFSKINSVHNSSAKSSHGDNGIVQNKIQRSDSANSSANAPKYTLSRAFEGRQLNESGGNVKKNALQSGYDRKLQEAIMAKMEETKRNADIRRSSSNEIGSSKPITRPMEAQDRSFHNREVERNSMAKVSGKLTKERHSADVPVRSSSMKPPESVRCVPQNKQKPGSSSKPREVVVDSRPKVPSNPKQSVSCEKTRNPMQTGARDKNCASSDVRTKQIIPSTRERPVSAIKSKPILPSDRTEKVHSGENKPRQLSSDVKSRQLSSDVKSRQLSSDVKSHQLSSDVKSRQFPPADVQSRQLPPPNARPRQFPPQDVRARQFPPNMQRKQFPPGDVRKKPNPSLKRRITDSDEEYDSEMDDFIDDGPQDDEDVSKHIREIFGYDRRKYLRIQEEDDDECMESNYASILKEEFISTKTGIMEDLEDIRREKEMERRKKAFKKGKQ